MGHVLGGEQPSLRVLHNAESKRPLIPVSEPSPHHAKANKVQREALQSKTQAARRQQSSSTVVYRGVPLLRNEVIENPEFKRHEIKVEHYIVSTGLRQ